MYRRAAESWLALLCAAAALAAVLALLAHDSSHAAWRRQARAASLTGGDPRRGAQLILQTGCGACHAIPGIAGADGRVGPPLEHLGGQVFAAGGRWGRPASVVAWIRAPRSIRPDTPMPDLGLSEAQARDIAAYLYWCCD